MQSLQTLLELLSHGRNIHINILDLSGILKTDLTELRFDYTIHSRPFCDVAKSTAKGFKLCLRCKMLANTKALQTKQAFAGTCLYGLYEVAYPVRINDMVAAIIYVGHVITDRAQTEDRIRKICSHTKVDTQELLDMTAYCAELSNTKVLWEIAEILSDYIIFLHEKETPTTRDCHWLIADLQKHANDLCRSHLSLKDLAILYRKNEKYLGRLFKQEVGISYHAYSNQLRLDKAETMLRTTSKRIIDIAYMCGFNHITYFNRLFQKRFGISPTEFRSRYNTEKQSKLG